MYLCIVLRASKGLSSAAKSLNIAGQKAMFGVLGRCHELHIHSLDLEPRLFVANVYVQPVLSDA